jgi:rare lipoprotein A (peptidoglycan hydrolase)
MPGFHYPSSKWLFITGILLIFSACSRPGTREVYIPDKLVIVDPNHPPADITHEPELITEYPNRLEEGEGWIELLKAGEAEQLGPNVLLGNRNIPLVANRSGSYAYPPEVGLASYYEEPQILATGEQFDPDSMTAAHKSLPFGTLVRCKRLDTHASVIVFINDRGPYVKDRIIDLSRAAGAKLDMLEVGIVPCSLEIIAYPLVEVMGPKGNG